MYCRPTRIDDGILEHDEKFENNLMRTNWGEMYCRYIIGERVTFNFLIFVIFEVFSGLESYLEATGPKRVLTVSHGACIQALRLPDLILE